MAHSQDGINWIVDEDAKAYSRTVEWEDGNVEMQGQLERPFLFFENGVPAYVFLLRWMALVDLKMLQSHGIWLFQLKRNKYDIGGLIGAFVWKICC